MKLNKKKDGNLEYILEPHEVNALKRANKGKDPTKEQVTKYVKMVLGHKSMKKGD